MQSILKKTKNYLLYTCISSLEHVPLQKVKGKLRFFFYAKKQKWLWQDFPGGPGLGSVLPLQGTWVQSLAGNLKKSDSGL